MAELYTRDLGEREMIRNFILPKSAGETHYLCNETTIYIRSGRETRGNYLGDKRKQMRREFYI